MIADFLKSMAMRKGSDLHLMAGDPPRMRVHGDLITLDNRPLDGEELREAMYGIMPKVVQRQFEEHDSADFAHAIPDISRFRVNVFRHLNGVGAVFRGIPSKAFTLEDLGMPKCVRDFTRSNKGLILVTGKTGSGKTTTLAAMIDSINQNMSGHILTIEDPIEFVHQRQNCLISQREIGVHTPTFSSALHSALREDPDVILVGELRDLETMSIAMTAAEMGILVMGTLHTNGAGATIDRVVNIFPSDKQDHVRNMLSTSLRGVISQQLAKKKDGSGRVAALEILVNTSAVANLIRQGKLEQLENVMQSGGAMGMRTMDGALKDLMDGAMISGQEAYLQAFDKSKFERFKDSS
ncbi:MAG: type IV pilus twitching motility protein PilT [Gammaproteobacteria bacterium]|nr:type IV pilus twitching motility protein PilT [Gammaproteobacteria bacterium]MDH3508688.1 type IV pilus twitching motility protein PilT [Gammaproteobacteria bacterium]